MELKIRAAVESRPSVRKLSLSTSNPCLVSVGVDFLCHPGRCLTGLVFSYPLLFLSGFLLGHPLPPLAPTFPFPCYRASCLPDNNFRLPALFRKRRGVKKSLEEVA